MDSNTLRIGLMLIILVWSVISGITYMVRRSGNKDALRQLKQEGEPLTQAERKEPVWSTRAFEPAHDEVDAMIGKIIEANLAS